MEPHQTEAGSAASGTEATVPNGAGSASASASGAKRFPSLGSMPARLTSLYVVVAALWILVSDQLLAAIVSDRALLVRLGVAKGWVFVAVTAALLFFLMRREARHWTAEKVAREKAELVTHESEARFRKLFELAPLPVMFYGRDGVIARVNESFTRVMGYSAGEVPTIEHWRRLALPGSDNQRQVRERWAEAIAKAEHDRTGIASEEVLITCKSGEVRSFLVSGSVLNDGILVAFVDVTDRNRSEGALRASEARYRLLTQSTADVIWVYDVTTQRFTYMSPSVERLRGYTPEEATQQPLAEALTPESYAQVTRHFPQRVAAFLAGVQSAVTQVHEIEQRCKDGSTIWFETSSTLIKTADGGVQLFGVSRDITERRKMQAELRSQELLLRETTELAHVGGWEFDPVTLEGTWTEETARIHEVEPSEKIDAKRGLAFYSEADRPKIEAAVREAIAHGTPYDLELEIISARGNKKWVRTAAHPQMEHGKVVRIRGTFQDISDKRRAQIFTEGQKEALEMIVNGKPLKEILVALAHLIEGQFDGLAGAFMLLDPDGGHLRVAAAPSLPVEFTKSIDGMAVGPDAGASGTAVFRRAPVYVEDIETDPVRTDWKAAVLEQGLSACWATPIVGDDEQVFGTFAAYFKQPRKPDDQSRYLIELITHTASIAITRYRSEAALLESEEQFRAVVESAPEAIFVQTNGCFAYMNSTAVELLGASDARQLIGRPVLDQIAPKGRALAAERIRYLNERRLALPTMEQQMLRRDNGNVTDVEISAVPFVYRQVPGALVFARDISERRKAVEALRESEERFRQVVENMDEVFWMTDPAKNRILYVSPAYSRIWGRDPAGLLSGAQQWAEMIHTEDRDRVVEAMRTKADGGEYDETYRILRPDGIVRWVHERAFPIRDQDGRVFRVVGTATDITEHRTLETQLRQAQKMEAIGTLAGGIAHDFNNILGAISGFAELAKMDTSSRPIENSLDEILRACKRAGNLVRQILAFSRRQEQKRQPLQLWRVIDEATKLLRAALPSNIQFDIDLSGTAPAVLAEPTQIHQIVMNLCTNAAHAMAGRGGLLGVKLDRFEADEEFVKLHRGSRVGTYVRLTVSDNGHGMERATVDRIFEPFFTTKAPGEGTGLGLAVVHGIVHNHDGIITVYSQPGKGTTFHLYFPALESEAVEPAVTGGGIPQGQGQRILVVDDEVALVEMTGRVLKRLNYAVDTSTDAAEALATIRAEPKRYELVLTDLTMPGLSGLELASFALNVNPNIKLILMTGYFANLTTKQVRSLGIKEVLMKPISIRSLGETINRVLVQPNLN